jgi:polar amino acid transport system substrate-binding protein
MDTACRLRARRLLRRLATAMLCLTLLPLAWAQKALVLPAVSSYAQPPYVFPESMKKEGLAQRLVDLLRARLEPDLSLELQTLPRKRLELTLEGHGFDGAALFLSPEFLAREAIDGGKWSVPVMVDENVLVSIRPLELTTLRDLSGLRLGGLGGHIYRLLAPLLDSGTIQREDAADHVANLKKLCLGRVDFLVMSRSEFAGSVRLTSCPKPFASRSFPERQLIQRRVLVRLPDERRARRLLDATAQVACSAPWLKALEEYGLSGAHCDGASSGNE